MSMPAFFWPAVGAAASASFTRTLPTPDRTVVSNGVSVLEVVPLSGSTVMAPVAARPGAVWSSVKVEAVEESWLPALSIATATI